MKVVTVAVCLRGSGGGSGEATGRRRRSPRKGNVLEKRKRDPGSGGRGETGGPCAAALPFAHPLRPRAGWPGEGGGGDWGSQSLGLAPSLRPPGSEAAGGHFSCGAAQSPGGLHVPTPRPSLAPAPRGPLPAAGRAGRERPRGRACRGPGLGAAGRGPARGRRAGGSGAEGRAGARREGAGSRYLYWAAAAAAAAPLWVNPK